MKNTYVTYGHLRRIDSYRFSSIGLDGLVKTLDNIDINYSKEEIHEKWNFLSEKFAYPHEYLNRFDAYQKPVYCYKKDFFSKLKNGCPKDQNMEK